MDVIEERNGGSETEQEISDGEEENNENTLKIIFLEKYGTAK